MLKRLAAALACGDSARLGDCRAAGGSRKLSRDPTFKLRPSCLLGLVSKAAAAGLWSRKLKLRPRFARARPAGGRKSSALRRQLRVAMVECVPSSQATPLLPSTGAGRRALVAGCASVHEFRAAALGALGVRDRVLVLGSSANGAGALGDEAAERVGAQGAVVWCDVRRGPLTSSKDVSALATPTGPGVRRVLLTSVWEVLGTAVRSALGGAGPDVVVLDLNSVTGNDLLLDTMALVTALVHAYGGVRLVVAKSADLELACAVYASSALLAGSAAALAQWRADRERRGSPALRVLGAIGVHEYRQAIALAVRSGDHCLEIGCHLGNTSKLMHEAARQGGAQGSVLGVDIGVGNVLACQRAFPELQHAGLWFATADGTDMDALKKLERHALDVVFVDVGGLSSPDGLLEALAMIRALHSVFPTARCIVIKSTCVQRFARGIISGRALLEHMAPATARSCAVEAAGAEAAAAAAAAAATAAAAAAAAAAATAAAAAAAPAPAAAAPPPTSAVAGMTLAGGG